MPLHNGITALLMVLPTIKYTDRLSCCFPKSVTGLNGDTGIGQQIIRTARGTSPEAPMMFGICFQPPANWQILKTQPTGPFRTIILSLHSLLTWVLSIRRLCAPCSPSVSLRQMQSSMLQKAARLLSNLHGPATSQTTLLR